MVIIILFKAGQIISSRASKCQISLILIPVFCSQVTSVNFAIHYMKKKCFLIILTGMKMIEDNRFVTILAGQ